MILQSIVRSLERKAYNNAHQAIGAFSANERGPVEKFYLDEGYRGIYYAGHAAGGYPADAAFQLSAFITCVKIISEDIATLPLFVYQKRGEDVLVDTLHPLYRRLHDSANPDISAMQFRETMTANMLVYGKAYAWQERNRQGEVVAMWPIPPDRMREEKRRDGTVIFIDNRDGSNWKTYRRDELFILCNFLDLSPLKYARDAIRLGLTQQEYAMRFFDNSQIPPLVLEHPGVTDADKVKQAWAKAHEGRWFAPAVLQQGMKAHTLEPDAAKAQLREQREMQLLEIVRPFRLSPHKLGDMGRATWANVSANNISHLTDCLRPHQIRWEQAINQQLLRDEHPTRYAEHEVAGMLRGDFQMQTDGFRSLLAAGVYSINEVRGFMNMNAIKGGDAHLVQLNQGTVQNVARGLVEKPANGVVDVKE